MLKISSVSNSTIFVRFNKRAYAIAHTTFVGFISANEYLLAGVAAFIAAFVFSRQVVQIFAVGDWVIKTETIDPCVMDSPIF